MTSPEDVLSSSPVDFQTAVAYALQPDMRRLLIIYLVGAVLTPGGLALFSSRGAAGLPFAIVEKLVGLALLLVGLALLFGGLVGVLFKVVTDANRLAAAS